MNDTDRQFVMTASMSNYAEIQAGQVASTKGRHEGIRHFGEMMVTDHTNAGNQLKSIASTLQLQTFDSLDDAHKRLADTLASLTGRAFDSVYINSQVLDHQKAIALFQNEANNGQHVDLRKFASDLLPHLQMHYQHADSLRNAIADATEEIDSTDTGGNGIDSTNTGGTGGTGGTGNGTDSTDTGGTGGGGTGGTGDGGDGGIGGTDGGTGDGGDGGTGGTDGGTGGTGSGG